jgi:TP901 family phage tail tape measure protein
MADFGKMFKVGLYFDMIDRVSGPLTKMNAAMMATEHRALRIGESLSRSGQAMSSVGMKMAATGAAMAAAFVLPTKAAIEFESKMADIRKVVDFPTPESFKRMGDDILKMTYGLQGIPMAVNELQDIVKAAGESDVAKTHEELLAFARDAAKLGVAFDVAGAQAGEIMTSWRMSMNLAQDQALQLADAVNYLSNNMASNAADLSEILKRQGAVGVNSGLTAVQTAALASAFKSTGIQTEIAATGMKNFLNALTQGEKATPKDTKAFESLGLDAVKVAKAMQQDALPTIMDVLQRIQKIEAWRQPAIISQIFGEESKGAIMPLLTNLDLVRKAFGLVGDSTKYAGSMQAEFDVRSKTTANALQLAGNAIKALGINIGSIFLPYVAEAANRVNLFVERLINWGKEHQTLAKIMTLGTAGVSAFLLVVGGGLTLLGLFVSGVGSGITAIVKLVSVMRLLAGAFSLASAGAVLLNPVTLVIAALAASAVVLWKNWDRVRALFSGFWGAVSPSLTPFINALKTVYDWAGRAWDKIKEWTTGGETISVPKVAFDNAQAIAEAAEAGRRQGEAFAGHLSRTITDTQSIWSSITQAASTAGAGIDSAFRSTASSVIQAFNWIGSQGQAAWAGIQSTATEAGTAIHNSFQTASNAIVTAFGWVGQKWDQVISAIKTAADGLVSKFTSVWTAITSFDLFGAGQRMIQRLIDGIMSKISAVTEAVKGVASSISNYLVPHSPIPMGPLSEIHLAGYRLMDMVRQGIEASPITRALNDALAYTVPQMTMAGAQYPFQTMPQSVIQQSENQQSFPALSRARAGSGWLAASPSVQVSLSYSPQITIQGDKGTGATQKLLTENARDMEDRVYNAVRRAMQRRDRIEFGAEDIHY